MLEVRVVVPKKMGVGTIRGGACNAGKMYNNISNIMRFCSNSSLNSSSIVMAVDSSRISNQGPLNPRSPVTIKS